MLQNCVADCQKIETHAHILVTVIKKLTLILTLSFAVLSSGHSNIDIINELAGSCDIDITQMSIFVLQVGSYDSDTIK